MSTVLLTPDQVAEVLQVPKATIYSWSSRGNSGLRFVRVGKHLRVRPADLDEWLESKAS